MRSSGIGALFGLAALCGCRIETAPPPPRVDASAVDAAAPAMRPFAVDIDGQRQLVLPAHGRAELIERRLQLATALPLLTPEERKRVLPRMDVIACVSIAEGAFDGVATHAGDPMASIGIFQWAGERTRPISEGSSLQRFLVQLQARSACDHCAARDAWQALTDAGLGIDRGAVKLRGAPATGAMLEVALGPRLRNPAVQAYQLVAAVDWIDHIAGTRIGLESATLLGALLPSDRGLCTAVLLGVNRPAWVAPSLEAGLVTAHGSDEDRLIDAFRAAALERYPARERLARAARLLTSESLR